MTPPEAFDAAQRALKTATALWREGLVPECHSAMLGALGLALAAWLPDDAPEGTREREELALSKLAERGYRRVERLRAVLAASGQPPHAEVAPVAPSRAPFEPAWLEAERLLRFTRRELLPARVRRRRRWLIRVGAALVVLLVVLTTVRLWGRVRTRASAIYSPDHPADYVVDGIDTTEWLLPDRELGWLDVFLPRPRQIDSVRVYNGHNQYWLDRGSRRVRVTAYSEHAALASGEGEFTNIKDGRSFITLKLKAKGVTRLRVEVLSFMGAGAALAEIEIR